MQAMATAVVLVALVLTGCAPGGSSPQGRTTASPTEPVPATTSTPVSGAPTLHPDGSAQDNLPVFTAVVATVWASDKKMSNRAYIDALVAAGFTKADMQMTADATTVDYPAESFQFSVRWGTSECLVGQVGPSTGEPVTAVLPQLAEGRCLIGNTPPVDG